MKEEQFKAILQQIVDKAGVRNIIHIEYVEEPDAESEEANVLVYFEPSASVRKDKKIAKELGKVLERKGYRLLWPLDVEKYNFRVVAKDPQAKQIEWVNLIHLSFCLK